MTQQTSNEADPLLIPDDLEIGSDVEIIDSEEQYELFTEKILSEFEEELEQNEENKSGREQMSESQDGRKPEDECTRGETWESNERRDYTVDNENEPSIMSYDASRLVTHPDQIAKFICSSVRSPELEPTEAEIQEAIRQITKKYPQMDLQTLSHRLLVWSILQQREKYAQMIEFKVFQSRNIEARSSIQFNLADPDEAPPIVVTNKRKAIGPKSKRSKQSDMQKPDNTKSRCQEEYYNHSNIQQKSQQKKLCPIIERTSKYIASKNEKALKVAKINSHAPSGVGYGKWRWDASGQRIKLRKMGKYSQKYQASSVGSFSREPISLQSYKNQSDKDALSQAETNPVESSLKQGIMKEFKIRKRKDDKLILTNQGMLPHRESFQTRFIKAKDPKGVRDLEREIAAKAFCDKGYGIPKLRDEIQESGVNINIDDKRYKAVSCGFVADSFRRMETFLGQDCKIPIKRANAGELKVLYTILLNCRDNFYEKQALTFVKFVKLTFQLGEVEIDQDQTVKLYNRFMESLAQKLKVHKYDSAKGKFALPKSCAEVNMINGNLADNEDLWTRQRELQFIEAYQKEQSIKCVRNYFKDRYSPEQMTARGEKMEDYTGIKSNYSFSFFQAITDMKVLTRKFHKIIRRGLRKVQVYSQSHEGSVPLLKRICDDVIKRMFCAPDGAELRRIIFEAQKKDVLDNNLGTQAINIINSFNDLMIQQRQAGIQREPEPDYSWRY